MRNLNTSVICLFGVILTLFQASNATELADPYEILHRHYDAIGGLEKLKAEETSHFEAKFVLVGTGLEGTFEQWSESPVKNRQELDLKVFKQTSGDNGEVAWVVDTNGKLKIMRDEGTQEGRQLTKLIAEFAHLDQDSPHFSVTLDGIEDVDEESCYAIHITNNVNTSELKYFISTESFLMKKTINYGTDGGESHTKLSDYREINGVLHAFKQHTESVPTHQTQELSMTLMETNLELDPGIFEAPVKEADDFHFLAGVSSEDVEFQFHENHIYMYVTINCDKQLWVLDSGASMTVIDKEYARELGVLAEGSITGSGVSHTVEMEFVTIPGLSVKGIQIDEQRAVSIDLGQIFDQLRDLKVAGILGYDFMSRFVSKIDYANEKISFYHPDSFSYDGEGSVVDSPLNDQNMFTVPMTVEGEFAGRWRFDTGASSSGFHFSFAESNGFLDRPGVERQAFGAGGSHVTKNIRFAGANIAGFDLPPLLVSVPMEKGNGAMAEKSLIGNLGSNVFRHFVVYLDYERQQIIFEKGDEFGQSFPTSNSGIQIWYPGGEKRVEIRFVAPGTSGEKAGFRVDDRILAINGIPVEQLNGLHAIRELMEAQPGTSYDLSILRSGEALNIKLKLEDSYE